jgi:hypothetical protein
MLIIGLNKKMVNRRITVHHFKKEIETKRVVYIVLLYQENIVVSI